MSVRKSVGPLVTLLKLLESKGDISGTKRAIIDPLVSKRPEKNSETSLQKNLKGFVLIAHATNCAGCIVVQVVDIP